MNTSELCHQVSTFLSEEVSCFEAYEGVVGCNLPISYPDGDSVTVYVVRHDSYWEVTDHGEGYGAVLARWTPNLSDFKKVAQPICESLGVAFVDGRVSGGAKDESSLVVLVWAVARAAARVAEGVSFYRPRKRPAATLEASESFVDEVANELSTRDVELGRNVKRGPYKKRVADSD